MFSTRRDLTRITDKLTRDHDTYYMSSMFNRSNNQTVVWRKEEKKNNKVVYPFSFVFPHRFAPPILR